MKNFSNLLVMKKWKWPIFSKMRYDKKNFPPFAYNSCNKKIKLKEEEVN
jgi:hypothetical protein